MRVRDRRRRPEHGLPHGTPFGFDCRNRFLLAPLRGLPVLHLRPESLPVLQVLRELRDVLRFTTQPVGDLVRIPHDTRIEIDELPLAEECTCLLGDVAALLPVSAQEFERGIAARPSRREILVGRNGLLGMECLDHSV